MLILASASPRRSEILTRAGFQFIVRPTDADESVPDGLSPKQTAERLSLLKARAALISASDGDVIVAADTIVTIGGAVLGKPKDKEQAYAMLQTLSGKTHTVYTGVTVIDNGDTTTFSVATDVVFYDLSDKEIKDYIATGEPFDKAGAYGIQGYGSLLVKEIRGDFYNVMGLPIAALSRVLRKEE